MESWSFFFSWLDMFLHLLQEGKIVPVQITVRCLRRPSAETNDFYQLKPVFGGGEWFCKEMERWWFQTFFLLTPTWGSGPIWLIFFKWVETTNYWFMASQKWQFSQTCPLDGAWENECHLQNEISTGIHDEFLVRQTTRWWWFQWCCFYTPPKKIPWYFGTRFPIWLSRAVSTWGYQ